LRFCRSGLACAHPEDVVSKIRIGMIGCGVVGQGVMRLLKEHVTNLEARLGGSIEVRRIVVRDASKPRGPFVPQSLVGSDVDSLLADPEIDVVVELMGGVELAGDYVQRALAAGKSVVTANKALIAARGHALMELAESRGADLYFEAAVAGGIPVIRVLREALVSDRIVALRGIVNGTSNYILSQMQERGLPFEVALQKAQEAGYAEADPTLDVGGGDAAHKLTILATLAFGTRVELSSIATEGIDRVQAVDIEFARRFGYVIKPLAVARLLEGGALDLRVHPALVDRSNPLAHINGALNAIHIEGAALGPCLLSGLGAGALPTAVSVVSDIVDLGRNHFAQAMGRLSSSASGFATGRSATVRPLEEYRGGYYLRFSVLDQRGVLGKLTTGLGARDVSIAQMVQEGRGEGEPVSVVLLTHPSREGDLRAALAEIDRQPFVVEPTRALRIEA
jgi:homoserine dehydrogenase